MRLMDFVAAAVVSLIHNINNGPSQISLFSAVFSRVGCFSLSNNIIKKIKSWTQYKH